MSFQCGNGVGYGNSCDRLTNEDAQSLPVYIRLHDRQLRAAQWGRIGAAAQRTGALKFRRHALRLSLNLDELGRTSRFQPRLNTAQIAFVTDGANLPAERFESLLESAMGLAQIGRLDSLTHDADHCA